MLYLGPYLRTQEDEEVTQQLAARGSGVSSLGHEVLASSAVFGWAIARTPIRGLCVIVWASLEHGDWVRRESIPRGKTGNAWDLY